jgi:hypothetical protein
LSGRAAVRHRSDHRSRRRRTNFSARPRGVDGRHLDVDETTPHAVFAHPFSPGRRESRWPAWARPHRTVDGDRRDCGGEPRPKPTAGSRSCRFPLRTTIIRSWTGGWLDCGRAGRPGVGKGEEPAGSADAELVAEQVGVRGDANEPGTL